MFLNPNYPISIKKKLTFSLTLLILSLHSFGQIKIIDPYYKVDSIEADTFKIYESKRGVAYCNYYSNWKHKSNCLEDSSHYQDSIFVLTSQDSLMLDTNAHYIKYYDLNNRLIWEGLKHSDPYLVGDIKYYRKNGRLDRIEHWNTYIYIVRGRKIRIGGSAPVPSKIWKYFGKNGKLNRTIEYTCWGEKELEAIQYVEIETFYTRSGKVKDYINHFPRGSYDKKYRY